MPAMGLTENIELLTRNNYTKVDCEFNIKLNGRELPSMAVMGEALEAAIALVQEKVTQSYKVVPERVAGTTA